MCTCVYIYMYIYRERELLLVELSMYNIYVFGCYVCMFSPGREALNAREGFGKGRMGSALMESLRFVCLDRGTLGVLPLTITRRHISYVYVQREINGIWLVALTFASTGSGQPALTRDFLGTPVNLRLYPQKWQGVPFSPICQNTLVTFAAAPLVLTPFIPQPKATHPRLGSTREQTFVGWSDNNINNLCFIQQQTLHDNSLLAARVAILFVSSEMMKCRLWN